MCECDLRGRLTAFGGSVLLHVRGGTKHHRTLSFLSAHTRQDRGHNILRTAASRGDRRWAGGGAHRGRRRSQGTGQQRRRDDIPAWRQTVGHEVSLDGLELRAETINRLGVGHHVLGEHRCLPRKPALLKVLHALLHHPSVRP